MKKVFGGGLHRSHYIAIGIGAVIFLWFLSGMLGGSSQGENGVTAAEIDAASDAATRVRVVQSVASERRGAIVIRGRTAAKRAVQVRAETQGTVSALPVEKGERVKKGQILCHLNVDARGAQLAEAQAVMRQRQLEHDASRQLAAKGYRAATTAAGSKAAYDAASAHLKRMQIELKQTEIIAPFDGVLDERPVEIGDYMRMGDPCGLVVELDPLLVVGQVAEDRVNTLTIGSKGSAKLVTGDVAEGTISFVAKSADPETRTFRVELEVPNKDFAMRAGVTAEITVPGKEIIAHRIPSAVITLDDRGIVGVRTVNTQGVVEFNRIELIDDTPEGLWVTGLPPKVTLITVGQNYVKDGEKVEAVPADQAGDAS
ncbi:MAG: efflux RND transporter periplasmic adaptor subunit [Parvibaculum sp.]|nr:efflux RND transporter periplasmic adaptor subunit [Parvibaculum sp.]